jgi:hypothetical protein
MTDPLLDTHIIAHFPADTITYEEPTILSFLKNVPRIESHALHIYYIYHKNTTLGT